MKPSMALLLTVTALYQGVELPPGAVQSLYGDHEDPKKPDALPARSDLVHTISATFNILEDREAKRPPGSRQHVYNQLRAVKLRQ